GMLARYGGIDLQLDSFPYSGGLTTLEALWMGVPTLTFPGDRIAGRHSASHLRRAGLGYLVATDRDDYMARAVAIARNPGAVRGLRGALRHRVAASPLVDGRAQAAAFADLVATAWACERFHR
ncbi:MAG: glycosyltransferase, partial [Alphaproteobacteria bacterium]